MDRFRKMLIKSLKVVHFTRFFYTIKPKDVCGNILKLKESLNVLKSDQIMKLKLGDRIRHTTELGTPMIIRSSRVCRPAKIMLKNV